MQHFCETSTSQLALTAMLRNFTRTLVGFVLIGFPFAVSADCVILLHGLARTSASMDKMATAFADREYAIANINYPSRKLPIQDLAPLAVEKGLVACPTNGVVHFVTHSVNCPKSNSCAMSFIPPLGMIPVLLRVCQAAALVTCSTKAATPRSGVDPDAPHMCNGVFLAQPIESHRLKIPPT